jgi:hypothetical protein
MDDKKDNKSNKKRWQTQLTKNGTLFLDFIRDSNDGNKPNKDMGLEFAVVSIFYRVNRAQRLMTNMRVSKCFNIYGNDT